MLLPGTSKSEGRIYKQANYERSAGETPITEMVTSGGRELIARYSGHLPALFALVPGHRKFLKSADMNSCLRGYKEHLLSFTEEIGWKRMTENRRIRS